MLGAEASPLSWYGYVLQIQIQIQTFKTFLKCNCYGIKGLDLEFSFI